MTSRTNLHGIPVPPPAAPPNDPARTVRWRRDQLLAAGYDELAARRLAADPDVDVHVLLTLVEARGADRSSGLAPRRRAYPHE